MTPVDTNPSPATQALSAALEGLAGILLCSSISTPTGISGWIAVELSHLMDGMAKMLRSSGASVELQIDAELVSYAETAREATGHLLSLADQQMNADPADGKGPSQRDLAGKPN